MSIMDMIRKWNENKKAKSEKFKEMQEDYRLQKMLLEREKSSNRRELEKFEFEQDEKMILQKLEEIRNQKNKDSWKGNNFNSKNKIISNRIQNEKSSFLNNFLNSD